MTGSRRGREGDEDLVVLARRRPLADGERRELGLVLDADPALRIAHDVGRAFDDVAFVRPGDEALIARVADRTLGIGNRRVAARRWRLGAAVAAGFLLFAGVAAAYRAGIGPLARHRPAVKARDVAPPAPPARSRAGARSAPPTAVPPVAPVLPAPAIASDGPGSEPYPPVARPSRAAVGGRSIVRPAARAALSSLASPEPDEQPPAPAPAAASAGAPDGNVTAADLFRRAGAARSAGALAQACALYRDLEARFPAAEEARLSHVSLGKLLLAMGQPREAERHFAIYLAGDTGALAAEAAFGRAQSFERMGRARDERDAWLALLREFPGSVYAAAARRRIAALEASGVGPPDAAKDVPAGAPGSAPGTVR